MIRISSKTTVESEFVRKSNVILARFLSAKLEKDQHQFELISVVCPGRKKPVETDSKLLIWGKLRMGTRMENGHKGSLEIWKCSKIQLCNE